MTTTRLVQLQNKAIRAVALVSDPELILINGFTSVYELALKAIDASISLKTLVEHNLSADKLNYDTVYNGKSEWQLLPAFDHPENPMNCMVSGTGLTHKNSALNRQAMHQSADIRPTDSIVMYQWGVEGGNPANGEIGVQPEWFYKGNGSILKAHGESLEVPNFADDGGEEPELAGVYIIDKGGTPHRIGFTTGNEFSDHVMEKKNYLYLAPSKLRECAIGPELTIDPDLSAINGKVSVRRSGAEIWSSPIKTGEANMAHSLQNLEYHHFKYPGHRIPLQAHVHFLGADAFSFGKQIKLRDGDEMIVQWDEMGRALKNYVHITPGEEKLIKIRSL